MSITRFNTTRLLAPALALLTLAGCGENVFNRFETKGELGVTEEVLEISSDEFTCPHLVNPDGVEFKTGDVQRGEISQVFGPMSPCGTKVSQSGLCEGCKNAVHVPGDKPVALCGNFYYPSGSETPVQCDAVLDGWSESSRMNCSECGLEVQGARLSAAAVPQMNCPYEDCGEALDPVAVRLRGQNNQNTASRADPGQCPHCQRYFESEPSDVAVVIGDPEAAVCPGCGDEVDPSHNACANAECELGGTIRNVSDFDGVCWSCGGVGLCPDCDGAGDNASKALEVANAEKAPKDCYRCGSSGRCEACDGSGFSTYTGGLPRGHQRFDSEGAIPNSGRKFDVPSAAPGSNE